MLYARNGHIGTDYTSIKTNKQTNQKNPSPHHRHYKGSLCWASQGSGPRHPSLGAQLVHHHL